MKKILFVLHYPPPVHGAAMMGQYIKDSVVINSAFNCRYINLGTSVKVEDIGSGGLSKINRFLAIIYEVLKQLVVFRPALVYFTLTATGAGFFKDACIVLLSKLFGKKIVCHFHNKGVSRSQDKWYYNIVYRLVFSGIDVILLSPHLYIDVEKYVKPTNTYYCPNGVPDTAVKTFDTVEKSKSTHLLFLSNLIETKGVLDLVKACEIMKTNGTEFKCTIIGGEGDISAVQLNDVIVKQNLQSYIEYAGKRYGKEKALAYSNADIFVFPTYYPNECFPLVLLEAMQYELPIISTFEGGIQDIVVNGKTGCLVQGQNVPELAKLIEKLIHDERLRKRLGAKGRERYEEKFTLVAFEKNLVNVLETIADT